MQQNRKLGKNILILTIGSLSSKLLSFFFLPIYTAILTTSEYGVFDLISTTVTLLMPIFTLIISESILRFSLDKDISKSEVFTIGLLVNIVGFLLLFLLSPLVLLVPNLKSYYWFIILYYFSYSFGLSIQYFARGINKVNVVTIGGVLSTFLAVTLNVLFLVVFRWGLIGYLSAAIISNIVSSIVVFLLARMSKFVSLKKQINKKLMRDMLKYSIPMIPNSISWWISNSIDRYFVIIFCGIAQNGIYSVAYKIPTLLSVASGIFIDAWRLSAVDSYNDNSSIEQYSKIYSNYVSFTMICATIIILFNKFIAKVLYSNEFFQAWFYVPVLVLAVMFSGFANYVGTIYTSAKKTNILFYSSLLAACVNLVLNYLLIPHYGLMGASIATLVSYIVIWLFRLIDSRRIMAMKLKIKEDIACYVLLIAQTVICCLNFSYSLYISILICVGLLFLKRAFIREMVNIVIKSLSKILRSR